MRAAIFILLAGFTFVARIVQIRASIGTEEQMPNIAALKKEIKGQYLKQMSDKANSKKKYF